MGRDLPIWVMEPDPTEKKDSLARKLADGGTKTARMPETIDIDEIKVQLRRIREHTRDNIHLLARELIDNLSQKYPQVRVKLASDGSEAVRYISGVSGGINTISINNSSVVTQELRPGLVSKKFTVVDSYFDEFDLQEREKLDYWDLPRLLDKNISGTFDVSRKMDGIGQPGAEGDQTKEYLAVLGVNAVSAEDGTCFFLQHFTNIYRDLTKAQKVFLIIGLDKIVKTREDALLQTRCMGIFGLESRLLVIQPRPDRTPSMDDLVLPPSDKDRELHIVILDNGRSSLAKTKFKDSLLCIGCLACNRHCPIRRFFTDVGYIWSPRNYLNQFLFGISDSIDVCLHCESCRIECPLEIDIPASMWQAKIDHAAKHGRSLHHKILGMPELLAKLGTAFAPLANWMTRVRPVRILMELVTGIDRKTVLPVFHLRTFKKGSSENEHTL